MFHRRTSQFTSLICYRRHAALPPQLYSPPVRLPMRGEVSVRPPQVKAAHIESLFFPIRDKFIPRDDISGA
jgi:hypothetical protein